MSGHFQGCLPVETRESKPVKRIRQIDTVFSVCASRDIDVWAIASRYIRRYIDARSYVVIVPDREVDLFKARTGDSFQVLPESECVGIYDQQLREIAKLAGKERFGWYLQQVIKISFLSNAGDDEVFLIWDADTVPLRSLDFVAEDGALRYYRSEEFHRPYFTSINRLLGLEKKVDYSFIAQCFAIRGRWAKEFFAYIEDRSGCHWVDALVSSVDFREACGFSEYETLGTFLSHFHASEIRIAPGKWERNGRSLTGEARYLGWPVFRRYLKSVDFVSYERWDMPFEAFPGLIRRLLRLFLIRDARG